MKNPITYLVTAALLVAALAAGPAPVLAQSAYDSGIAQILRGQAAGLALTADDTSLAVIVRYIGTQSGLVAVAANGDITFTQGATGSEAASTEFECPVSGALGGVIDVSDAACNTLGEVVDTINASTSWRAVIIDGLRSDSSNDTLLTFSATAATAVNGYPLYWDTDTAFSSTIAILPTEARKMPFYLQGRSLRTDPYAGTLPLFWYGNATSTYGSGTSTLSLVSVKATYATSNLAGTETATTILSLAGGATTAAKEVDFRAHGVYGRRGEKLLFRMINSAAAASVTHTGVGRLLAATSSN